ncbi:MAG: 30S ribosomal protein S7 [Deltaproteobacteria bacterium RIFCSPLOWO2_02_FULL_44_10]|nr:MAG: 30S ribosomal protein S7 [Deltaproteobacteria bacterium RIFCSPHIGHO2_02_FULL_44_16]OGQ45119.1 MAG: 30S ribosomal protein S7 [Deltaproteobacteria bacterium RIFCSPLOWO2_02_FULL_44_10]
MPRKKRKSLKRDIIPDPKFHDRVIAKLVNTIMWGGKKAVAESRVYKAFDVIHQKKGEDPITIFKKALDNVKPKVEVRSRRVGGATYQVPVEVRSDRREALGLRWLVQAARARKEQTFDQRFSAEILEAFENKGAACKKREDTHKMAEANKAFAHYKW